MQVHTDAFFLFVGSGDEVDLMKRSVGDLDLNNILILPPVNQNEFINILSECDIGMFSLSKNHTNHNFPGKILAYMQQEKAVLGSVNIGNDIIQLFNSYNAGYITVNSEDKKLFDNAVSLLEQGTRKKLTSNANEVLANEFSVKRATLQIRDTFKSIG